MARSTVKPFRVSPLSWPLDAGQIKGLSDMLEDIYQRLRENDSGFDAIDADDITEGTLDADRTETVAGVAGTYGDATNVPQVTVDTHGRVVAAVEVPLSLPATTHDLLSATHPDTVAASPALGDLVIAQAGAGSATPIAWLDGLPFDYLPTSRDNGGEAYWLDGLPAAGLVSSGAVKWKRLAKGTAGQSLVSTALGVEWGAAGGGGSSAGDPVGAHAQQSGDVSVTSAVETAISLGATSFDNGGFWVIGAPTRMTVPNGQDGYYLVHAQATFSNPVIGFTLLRIYKNGAQIAEQEITADNTASPTTGGKQVSVIANLVAGDYIEVKVYVSNSLGATTMKGGAASTFVQITKLLQSETIGELLPTPTRGTLVKGNAAGTAYDALAVGAAGTVLLSDGTDPGWSTRPTLRDVAEVITGVWDFSNGLKERGRSALIGEWTSAAYAAGNFTGSGAMTWGVDAADQVDLAIAQIGKTVLMAWRIDSTDVAGVADNTLFITIPGGLTAAKLSIGVLLYSDAGGAFQNGVAQAVGGDTRIWLLKSPVANWTLTAADNSSFRGFIIFTVA